MTIFKPRTRVFTRLAMSLLGAADSHMRQAFMRAKLLKRFISCRL